MEGSLRGGHADFSDVMLSKSSLLVLVSPILPLSALSRIAISWPLKTFHVWIIRWVSPVLANTLKCLFHLTAIECLYVGQLDKYHILAINDWRLIGLKSIAGCCFF